MQIIEIWKRLWRLWNGQEIRILILTSLCFQFGLVFLSPLRKRTSQKFLIFLLWSFYLSADYVAILALGNLLTRQNEDASCRHSGVGLMAFWAPFLLLHLGGPDTITSYSIEDNELWWRHFLGLAVQVVIAFLVLLKLVVIPRLHVAAAIVFIAGLLKYSERTWALRSSSKDQLRKSRFKPQPLPAQLPSNIVAPGNTCDPVQIIEAYEFFKIFKPFVIDHRLNQYQYETSKTYFQNRDAWKAFKLVEIELSFLYDVLHTKASLINGLCGCLWRFVSFGMISSAFVLFLKSEKRSYAKADIILSYILFGSALFMEFISLLLIITSDWMIVTRMKEKMHSPLKNLAVVIAKVMSCFFSKGKPRWSNSMGQYSLLSFFLRDKETIFRRILGAVKVKELWDKLIFIHSVPVPSELQKLLFEELKNKTIDTNEWSNFKELREFKLKQVLEQEAFEFSWAANMGFVEVALLWHMVTDLCFNTPGRGRNDNNSHSDREISLKMSNYMMYLLIMQPSMMPDGIEAKRIFKDICAKAKKIFRKMVKGVTKEEATEALLQYAGDDLRATLLGNACEYAKKLNQLAENKRWPLLRRVWVEMLYYAAINCKTYYHSKQLSQGGELLTHVMLLTVHMGIPQRDRSVIDTGLPLYD